MKIPRKLKKKIFGTKERPKRCMFVDLACGLDYTVETEFFKNGKAIEIFSRREIVRKPLLPGAFGDSITIDLSSEYFKK